jgi:hypothetical protein
VATLTYDLVCDDYVGRIIRLGHDNWEKHARRHPEVVVYHDRLCQVVREPSTVVETHDGDRHYYRYGIGEGRYSRLYLKVIVGIADGWIRTAFFVRSVDVVGEVVYVNVHR